jgi:dihydrofolate synthase/folylpolyglutamate synthase
MLSSMMPEAGLYTSPHLLRLNERIRIGDSEISDSDLKQCFERAKAAAENASSLLYPPTYFELVTAMAFLYFSGRVRFAILEVGLGGRLDATNIVRQDVSVITSIGLDHQQFLGSTLQEIAAEKAGIIKGSEPVVVGADVEYDEVKLRAGSHLIATRELPRLVRGIGGGFFRFDLQTAVRAYHGLQPRLAGRHQVENAIVAVRAAECLGLPEAAIRRGIETATWPGRLERFEGSPPFILDGAHNPHATRALAEFLAEFFPQGVWLIFGAMADKKSDEMVHSLLPNVRQWIFTRPQNARAAEPAKLALTLPGSEVQADVRSAIEFARRHAPTDTTVVICGSLYLIGEARSVLQ